jgi:hypothetical protein
LHIEEGLSGGAVFDPATGEILGIVTSRTSDSRGGFADSGALVVMPFLQANDIAAGGLRAVPHVAATPRPVTVTVVVEQAPAPRPLPIQSPLPLAQPELRPLPVPTLQAVIAVSVPRDTDSGTLGAGIVSWQAGTAQPKRFVFMRAGCRIAVTIDVSSLQFIVSHQALVPPHHRGALLGITLQQRAAATDACADVADSEPADGAYDATAMSFDGRHVTMRFVYAGDPDNSDRFPSDASLDVDLDGNAVTATVQFFDRDWAGSIALPLARTTLASVSSNW